MSIEIACIARYEGRQNMVHVSAILLDDDGNPIPEKIRKASVALLHNRTPMLTKEVTEKEYNEGEKAFYVFFVNPPVQTNMFVKFEVELDDDQTAKVINEVNPEHLLPYKGFSSNPMLAGRPVLDYTDSDTNPL